jgi:O-antigen/teichoic acid export membrane protein
LSDLEFQGDDGASAPSSAQKGVGFLRQPLNGRASLGWSVGGVGFSGLMQVAFFVLSSRLLSPSQAGLYSAGLLIIRFAGYIAQAGLGDAIVRESNLDQQLIDRYVAYSSLAGLTVTVLVAALAMPIAVLLDKPQLSACIGLLSPYFLIAGLGTVGLGIARKRLLFRGLVVVDCIATFVGYFIVATPMMFLGAGYLGLVAGALVQGIIATSFGISNQVTTFKGYFLWREGLKIGLTASKFSLVGLIDALSSQVDSFFVTRTQSLSSVGLYLRTSGLFTQGLGQVALGGYRVLGPVFSRDRDLPDQRLGLLVRSHEVVIFVLVAMTSVASQPLGVVLPAALGSEWHGVGPLAPALLIAAGLQAANYLFGTYLVALGRLRVRLQAQIIYASIFVVLEVIATGRGASTRTIALMWLSAEAFRQILYIFSVEREVRGVLLRTYARGIWFLVFAIFLKEITQGPQWFVIAVGAATCGLFGLSAYRSANIIHGGMRHRRKSGKATA